MGFSGDLQDLSLIDLLQLLHVSRKTGTLHLHHHAGSASLTLRAGSIVSARHFSPDVSAGSILVEAGATTPETLLSAVAVQEQAGAARKPIVSTLIELGHIDQQQGWTALKQLIERTVRDLVAMPRGTFEFELDQVALDDEFHHLPAEITAGLAVDIQHALMDALRILDENNRAHQAQPADPPEAAAEPPTAEECPDQADAPLDATCAVVAVEADEARLTVPDEPARRPAARPRRRGIVLSHDGLLQRVAQSFCPVSDCELRVVAVEQDLYAAVEQSLAEQVSAVAVFDFAEPPTPQQGAPRRGRETWRLARFRRLYPEVPTIVMGAPTSDAYKEAFRHGAHTFLPRPRGGGPTYVGKMKAVLAVLASCLAGVFEQHAALVRLIGENRMQMSALKERVQLIGDWRAAPDIPLTLLDYAAQHLSRCILFLVRREDLLGVGGVGVDHGKETMSTALSRLKIPLAERSLLRDVVEQGRVFQGTTGDPIVRQHLHDVIGAPACPEILLLPLLGEERAMALIYGDFGRQPPTRFQTDALEILVSVGAMGLQLALWRKQRGQSATRTTTAAAAAAVV